MGLSTQYVVKGGIEVRCLCGAALPLAAILCLLPPPHPLSAQPLSVGGGADVGAIPPLKPLAPLRLTDSDLFKPLKGRTPAAVPPAGLYDLGVQLPGRLADFTRRYNGNPTADFIGRVGESVIQREIGHAAANIARDDVLTRTGDLALANNAARQVGTAWDVGTTALGAAELFGSTVLYGARSMQLLSPDPYAVDVPSLGIHGGLTDTGWRSIGKQLIGGGVRIDTHDVITSMRDNIITTHRTEWRDPFGSTSITSTERLGGTATFDRFLERHFPTRLYDPNTYSGSRRTTTSRAWTETTRPGVTRIEPVRPNRLTTPTLPKLDFRPPRVTPMPRLKF